MEKLILTDSWGDESCSGTTHIAFEYESKDKFVFDILEKYKNHKWEFYYNSKSAFDTSKVEIFNGLYYTKGEIENIENKILTLEDWFKQNKQIVKVLVD